MSETVAAENGWALHEDGQPIVDLRGYQCPLPVLKTRIALRKVDDGAALWVRTDDPLAVLDIPNFCREYDQVLVEQKPGDEESHWFLVRRNGKIR